MGSNSSWPACRCSSKRTRTATRSPRARGGRRSRSCRARAGSTPGPARPPTRSAKNVSVSVSHRVPACNGTSTAQWEKQGGCVPVFSVREGVNVQKGPSLGKLRTPKGPQSGYTESKTEEAGGWHTFRGGRVPRGSQNGNEQGVNRWEHLGDASPR